MSSVAEYLATLAQQAGFDDESKAALQKVLANPKFTEELDKGVKRQSDYSRSMDEVKTMKQSVETQIQSWRDWYATASTRDAEREEELQALRAKVGTGAGSGNGNGAGAGEKGLTLKDIQEREGRMINIVKQMGRISSRHAANFHEELDVDAVEKIAIERGLTVDKAYDEYVAPRVKAASEAAQAEALKKARDEGLQEGLSKREVPGESARAWHPIFRSKPADGAMDPSKLTDLQRKDNFAAAWADAATKK
jgi:hypothetical protein